MTGVTIKTIVQQDGKIIQTICDDMQTVVSQKILNVSDEQIRQALIRLGWTPPENANNN